jgi:hypothetical protein
MEKSSPFCKTAAAPKIERKKDQGHLRAFVLITSRELDPTAQQDRCSRRMMTRCAVTISKRLSAYDNDTEQPGTLSEIDDYLENVEFIMQHFADLRQLTTANQVSYETVSVLNDDWLTGSSYLYSEFNIAYA